MTSTLSAVRSDRRAALCAGSVVSFVVAVRALEAIRPALLLDPDSGWVPARFLLWIGLLSATAVSGGLAAGLFFLWCRSRFAPDAPQPLPFRRTTLYLLATIGDNSTTTSTDTTPDSGLTSMPQPPTVNTSGVMYWRTVGYWWADTSA